MKITWKRRNRQVTVGRFNLHFVGRPFGARERIRIGRTTLYCLPGLRLFVEPKK